MLATGQDIAGSNTDRPHRKKIQFYHDYVACNWSALLFFFSTTMIIGKSNNCKETANKPQIQQANISAQC